MATPIRDPRQRFTETVADYDRFRPGYPAAALDWMVARAALSPGAGIADLGCGTGIFTRLLAARGFAVTGIDPNPAMIERARARGGDGATYLQGEATATGLPAASVDLVTGAQSFHWFELDPTLAEIARILAPAGSAAALWNERESTPLLDDYEALLRAHSDEYARVRQPDETVAALRALPAVTGLHEAWFPNLQVLDRDGLLGRAHSASYVVHGVKEIAAFDRALERMYDRHQVGGQVEFAYRTRVVWWRIAPGSVVG